MYTELFERIISGRCLPGSRLKEEALAEEFHLSRTPVREVLRQLEKDGLVRLVPHRGAVVVPFTADDIEDIYEIRRVLELLALDVSASSMSLQKLGELRSLIQDSVNSNDYRRHTEVDAIFHDYIIKSGRRRYLTSMLEQMLRLIQRFRELGFKDKNVRRNAVQEHLDIIDALYVRDITSAKKILSEHIQHSKTRALAQLSMRFSCKNHSQKH